jgi:hypothetical protein
MIRRLAAVAAALCAFAPPSANAAGGVWPLAAYRAVFEACRSETGATRLAIRRMTLAGRPTLLLVDAESLRTELLPAAGWRCTPTGDAAQQETRFLRALDRSTEQGPGLSLNAGLRHGEGQGSFVTGDLCPSRRRLDRAFFELLARAQPGAPVAVAISGRWLRQHEQDFDWLAEQDDVGALAISWVNHSDTHPYSRRRPDSHNYLLTKGVDLTREILAPEEELIVRGAVPSVFFRFPGLVADPALAAAVRAKHLVALGADGWMVFLPPLRPGAILLVHPNGNEPAGLRLFARKLEQRGLPRPFRPIEAAP